VSTSRRAFLQAIGLGGVAAVLAPAVRLAPAASPVTVIRGASLGVAAGLGWADVRNFGAIGDGRTDDTAAIQRAINSLIDGGTVWFPSGTYMVSGPIG
jgi:hypothetical protein